MSKKLKATVQAKEAEVKAAHGELTGKPTISTLRDKVTKALEHDKRFDTESHGYPEGSPEDMANEPYCLDILVPDDDGQMEAVVRSDEGKLFRVGFTWDGENVKLADGEPTPTEMTSVWATSGEDGTVKTGTDTPVPAPVLHCRDFGVAVKAESSAPWVCDQPVEFQWMPGGVKTITAHYQGKPITICVRCDASSASAVQASLDEWRRQQPKQEPFGCVEHREEEAALRPRSFAWKDEPEPGVYCTALPTELGARNVNGRIHRSWSPSFTTDAQYELLKCSCGSGPECRCGGALVFPEGAKGSPTNPAGVTGIGFSVGSLTNKPAFKDILPLRAKQAEARTAPETVSARDAGQAKQPQPETKAGNEQRKDRMKMTFVKARGQYTVGQEVELELTDPAVQDGDALPPGAAKVVLATQAAQRARDKAAIKAAYDRAVAREAIAPKDEAPLVKANADYDRSPESLDIIVELMDSKVKPVKAGDADLTRQVTSSAERPKVTLVRASLQDAASGYANMTAPQDKLIRAGKFDEAFKLSREASLVLKENFNPIMAKGDDFLLRDATPVKATDYYYADPDSQVGTLSTGLVLMRNLGYLVNKLSWLPYLSTDLSSEPAMFGQPIFTRYITPPPILTWVPGVGFTNAADSGFGAQQVSDAGAGTTQSAAKTLRSGGGGAYELDASNNYGIPNKSQPSTTDVTVTMNMFKATEIEIPVSKLAGTARALFAEQRGAQTYTLAEAINQYVLNVLFASTWSGTVTSYTKALSAWDIKGLVGIKAKLSVSKVPDMGRFCLMHTFYHDKLLEDTNLLLAKSILSLTKQDMGAIESGELPVLFGIKPLESQLSSATAAGVLTTWSDDSELGTTAITGFAGNQSSAVFVARVPQDYTKVQTQLGIPQTASIEIVTEPDSGLSVMVFKYADNGKMSLNQRVCLMWGAGQGNPRIGIVLKPA